MMFRHSLNQETIADKIENSVEKVIALGLRTKDITNESDKPVSTKEMAQAIIAEYTKL